MTTTTDAFNHNVVGNDGVKPSWNPEGLWKIWAMHEIYLGEAGGYDAGGIIKPLWVPNVLNYVENVYTHETFQVTALPLDTLIPVLEPIVRNAQSLTQRDILTIRGPGYGSADHKISIDDTVFPYRLDVSPFAEIRTVEARYAKIISGSIFGPHRVIGFMLSSTGDLVDDKIPLDLIADVNGVTNYHIKNVQVCYTNETIKNGDVLTVVLYSAAGHALSENQLVVVNTNFMRDGTAPREYIKTVYIESPYLSTSDPFELQLPLNWNNSSLNMIGVVEYQSGRKVRLPIDGRKFYLEGLQQLLSAIPGHRHNLMLKYALERDENTIHSVSSFSNTIAQPYSVRQVKINNSYTIKLYAFPTWDASIAGYRLKFFLVNLDRNQFVNVTPHVRFVSGTPLFDGHSFGVTQRLQVSLNLRDVFTTFKPFVHTQAFEISLYGSPLTYRSPWTVRQSGSDPSAFGVDLHAVKSVDARTIRIDSNITDYDDWYARMFGSSNPLLSDAGNPLSYPEPTHFVVINGSQVAQFPITDWNKDLTILGTLTNYSNIDILWKHVNAITEMIISVSSLILQPHE